MKKLCFGIALLLFAFLAGGCQKPNSQGAAMRDFDAQAFQILNQFAQEVAAARGFSAKPVADRANNRKLTGSLTSLGSFSYSADINAKFQTCLNTANKAPLTHEGTRKMAGELAQCIQNIIGTGNPVSSWGTQNLGPYSAENYAYLINYLGNGALPGSSQFNGFGNNIFGGMGVNMPSPQPYCGVTGVPIDPKCFGSFGINNY